MTTVAAPVKTAGRAYLVELGLTMGLYVLAVTARPWLIDHGAALYQHHSDRDLMARAREPFPLIGEHVLLPLASRLQAADERMAAALDPAAVAAAVETLRRQSRTATKTV